MGAFDPVAFAMGKAGVSRDLLSALMGGGGGGVPGDLETSGWATVQANAAVNGNNVDIASGSTSSRVTILPPRGTIHDTATFEKGDVLRLAIKINAVSHRLQMNYSNAAATHIESKSGLFTGNYAAATGSDVLTLSFTNRVQYLRFEARGSSGGTSSTDTANFDITGLEINGTVIYGKI